MIAQVQLSLQGALDHLRIVWQTGETLLESVPFEDDPECSRYNILLAVQEMLTNVLRHGVREDPNEPVQVRFITSPRHVEVTILDMGPEFNPLEFSTEHLEDREGHLQESGYGIYITKMVMDDVVYCREKGCNSVKMTKFVSAGIAASSGSTQGRA